MKNLRLDPYGKYNGNEVDYVLECLDSENLNNKKKPWVYRFESEFCQVMDVKYAVAHNSGTSTLHSCLEAAGVGFDDEVIMPAQTVAMVAFAAIAQNAIPVFADSDPDTFNISVADLEERITSKTKAIIAVHMHGLPADMGTIMEVARKNNLVVIEDCAQSILASYKGKLVGTIGDMASFSFETKKHLSTGEGGMAVTNDEELATSIRKFGGLGYKTLEPAAGMRSLLPREFQNPNYKRHDALGLNYRMPEICAAIGLAQLERVTSLVRRRQEVAQYFLEGVEGCDWVIPQKVPEDYTNTYWTFTVKYEGMDFYGVSWEKFYQMYRENGGDGFYGGLSLVYLEPFMQKVPFLGHRIPADHPALRNRFVYDRGLCPVAESIQPKLMQFKTNYRNLEVARIKAEALRKTIDKVEGKK